MSIEAVGFVPMWTQGDRLRKARETTGLTAGEFADRIGVNRKTVYNYETDSVAPRTIVMRAWSLATGVSLTWLETGNAPSPTRGDEASGLSPLPGSIRRPYHYE